MRRHVSIILGVAMLFYGTSNAIPAGTDESKPAQKEDKFAFPYFIPGSRIVIGKELVDEVNALTSKDEQVQFLIKILPPTNQKEKLLTIRQVFAVRLLSLTGSEAAIDPLLKRLDYGHTSDGSPCVHALARLGERVVEPVVKALQEKPAPDNKAVNSLAAVLYLIKKDQFPKFIDELRQRDDVKLSDEVVKRLLLQVELSKEVKIK